MKGDKPSSRFLPHAESWAPSDYIWDDVRLVATSDPLSSPRRSRGHASMEAEGGGSSTVLSKPSKRKTNLACRIEGCPKICDKAYTARSRVCLPHMQAGGV
jgi:hypothetical protein